MSVGKRVRFKVFKRDRFTCQYCGRKPPDAALNCDHILASSLGGSDELDNLITSCWDCNSGKSDKPLERIAAPINFNIEEQTEKLEQIRAYADQLAKESEYWKECEEIVIERWCTLEGQPPDAQKWLVSHEFEMAVKQFVKRLTVQEILNARRYCMDQIRRIPRAPTF